MKWTPDMIIALILVVGCLGLIAFGLNGEMKSILTMSAGWAFGAQYQVRRNEKITSETGKDKYNG